ncbi:MAG: hypothetical protein WDA60_11155 [Acidimicrobiia bacterium]|jgi:hypothetical protein
MYRFLLRALAPAFLAALGLVLTGGSAVAAPVVDADATVAVVPPVPAPIDADADLTVDPPAGTSLCADLSLAGSGTGGCVPGAGLPVPLPSDPTDVAPTLAIVQACVPAPAVCAAPLAGAVAGLPGAGLPVPALALPGGGGSLPTVRGTSVDACVALAAAGTAPSCDGATAVEVSDAGGSGGAGGGRTLPFTGSAARLLGSLGMGLLALGTLTRRLARVRV